MLEIRIITRVTNYRKYSGKQGVLSRVWSSWLPIPTGVGIALLGILQWRRLEKERKAKLGIVEVAKDWEVICYKSLPLRAFSRMSGRLSRVPVPKLMRDPLYGSFARLYSVNTNEMSLPMNDYNSFADFFARDLKYGVRPLDKQSIVSPADGTVLNVGKVESLQIEQVKGITYSIKAFLGSPLWKNFSEDDTDINFNQLTKPPNFDLQNVAYDNWEEYKRELLHNKDNELYQCVIYLSPGDYHRFHSPVNWKVNYRRHFRGELLSVNPSIAKWIPGLFTVNERVVYFGTWQHGFFAFAAVGATNVGSIRVYDDKRLKTNTKLNWRERFSSKPKPDETQIDINWKKGEQIGEFRLGSTVVLLIEAPKGLKLNVRRNQHVKVGEGIFSDLLADNYNR